MRIVHQRLKLLTDVRVSDDGVTAVLGEMRGEASRGKWAFGTDGIHENGNWVEVMLERHVAYQLLSVKLIVAFRAGNHQLATGTRWPANWPLNMRSGSGSRCGSLRRWQAISRLVSIWCSSYAGEVDHPLSYIILTELGPDGPDRG